MAIAFVAATTAGAATGGNLTVNKPTGTLDGHIMIVAAYREAGTWTAPAGWSSIRDQAQSTTLWTQMFWKRASSEGASYEFALSTSTYRTIAIASFSGCLASGDPVETSNGTNSASGYTTLASVTTTTDGCMLVGGTGNYAGTNLTLRTGTITQATSGYLAGTEIWYKTISPAGASGTFDFNPSTQVYATVTAALIPAAAQTLEQEGYRWRSDDGNETGATWLANQDANITQAIDTNTRLRMLVNSTGNPDAAQFQLEWKLSTDSVWRKVQ
jgi:hypothetical protein